MHFVNFGYVQSRPQRRDLPVAGYAALERPVDSAPTRN